MGTESTEGADREDLAMEPVPETREALSRIQGGSDEDLMAALKDLGRRARAIVPECVGLSLGLVRDGVTFTLVATAEDLAAIDAAQYLEGGPCLRDDGGADTVEVAMDDVLDEAAWALFARASAAVGVASSLSLPIADRGRIIGGINLYAATDDAFTGHHAGLARALGATAVGAVRNGDLAFRSRRLAAETPERLVEIDTVDTATGMLAARHGLPVERARAKLGDASRRAGIKEAVVARLLVELLSP
jgi:hypothetical protein